MNTKEISNQISDQKKEEWSKPEVNIIGVQEGTLGITGSGGDSATYS